MERSFILLLVGLSSVGAYWVGAKGLGLSGRGLRTAVGKLLEGVGMTLVFLAVNLAVGMLALLATRGLTRGFVSLYLADDITLPVLSLLQGLAFQWWWERSAPSTRNEDGLRAGPQ